MKWLHEKPTAPKSELERQMTDHEALLASERARRRRADELGLILRSIGTNREPKR